MKQKTLKNHFPASLSASLLPFTEPEKTYDNQSKTLGQLQETNGKTG